MFGWLFKPRKQQGITHTPPHILPEQSQDPMEHIFNTIKMVSKKYIGDSERNFKGLSEIEIQRLEQGHGFVFPKAYRLFLKNFARGNLTIFDLQSYNLKGIADAQEVSKELLEQDGFTLPANHFAFSQWHGYQFYYFIHSGSDNPDTFRYLEGGNDPTIKPPEIYAFGSFTDWLIGLAIENVKLIGNLHNYETEKGIQILKDLLEHSDKIIAQSKSNY